MKRVHDTINKIKNIRHYLFENITNIDKLELINTLLSKVERELSFVTEDDLIYEEDLI